MAQTRPADASAPRCRSGAGRLASPQRKLMGAPHPVSKVNKLSNVRLLEENIYVVYMSTFYILAQLLLRDGADHFSYDIIKKEKNCGATLEEPRLRGRGAPPAHRYPPDRR